MARDIDLVAELLLPNRFIGLAKKFSEGQVLFVYRKDEIKKNVLCEQYPHIEEGDLFIIELKSKEKGECLYRLEKEDIVYIASYLRKLDVSSLYKLVKESKELGNKKYQSTIPLFAQTIDCFKILKQTDRNQQITFSMLEGIMDRKISQIKNCVKILGEGALVEVGGESAGEDYFELTDKGKKVCVNLINKENPTEITKISMATKPK